LLGGSEGLPNDSPALVPIELLLQIGLSVNGLRQGRQWDFEKFVAAFAYSDGWSGIQPFNNLKNALWHGHDDHWW
jgi:hypothetical protein